MSNMDETYTANAMENEVENSTVEAKATEVETNQNNDGDWRKVMIGGIAGIVLGAGSAYAAEHVTLPIFGDNGSEDPATDGTSEGENASTKVNFNGTAAIAHNVNDEMSFSEAFAAARAEVGPGGVFEWHGQLYGTYYAAEWDQMSKDEKEAYRESVTGAHHHHDKPSETAERETATVATSEGSPVSSEEENVTIDQPAKPTDASHESTTQEPDVEVALLGHQTVTNPDGSISEVGAVIINGHEAIVVDVDMDGNYDILGADINSDGQISEDEISSLQPGALTTDDFDANSIQNSTDNMYSNLPDYVNDADPSSFA